MYMPEFKCMCYECRGSRKCQARTARANKRFRREQTEKAKAAVSAEAQRKTNMAIKAKAEAKVTKPIQVCAMTTGQAIKWLQTLPPRAKMIGTCGDGLCMKFDTATKTVSVAECLT